MAFVPESVSPETVSKLEDSAGTTWTPLLRHACSFPPEIFRQVMLNLIRNPNINSNHLFRADISLERSYTEDFENVFEIPAWLAYFRNFNLTTVMVRTMIPRNPKVDKPLDQTCLLYERLGTTDEISSLVIYLPHISSPSESPHYHPAVRGIAFTHSYVPSSKVSSISIEYAFFDSEPRSSKLEKTAQHLLSAVYKHGQGKAAGYVKRVQHDVILPQAIVQNTYARLKAKYARTLIENWVETTDPGKHVFEDLGIAAFLIELWSEIYPKKEFPGFVDIGCGNGLLVHILLEEGFSGWGFDARRRKSWATYSQITQRNLKELVLIPSIIQSEISIQSVSNSVPHNSKFQVLSSLPFISNSISTKSSSPDLAGFHYRNDLEQQPNSPIRSNPTSTCPASRVYVPSISNPNPTQKSATSISQILGASDSNIENFNVPGACERNPTTINVASEKDPLPESTSKTRSFTKSLQEIDLNSNSHDQRQPGIHSGLFPKGTFIISNHADELTPWTPILANMSQSSFMMIPCCSHALNGARFRAPPPKEPGVSNSAYASLVVWVSKIAKGCGWIVEKEMLRIPSTRNTALIGRSRDVPYTNIDIKKLIGDYGGAIEWEENAMKLVRASTREH